MALAASLAAACATAEEPKNNTGADARTILIVDAPPGSPDARSFVDAPPGSPDASVVISPDAMVGPPDAMGCTTQMVQLLSNENLDLGSGSGWIENGAGYPIILSPTDPTYPLPVTPQTGNYAGWMGGVDSATRSMYQDIAVPAGATGMSVTGYRYIATEETSGVWDVFTITIRNTSNSVLETLGSLSNANATDSWLNFTYTPISSYAGQTVRLHFENTNDIINNTNFFIDSFAVRVTACL